MSTSVARGNYVVITTTFFDEGGNKVAPLATPVARFAWPGTLPVEVPMIATADPAIWTIKWDTSGVASGDLEYSVRAQGAPGFYIVDDGTIDLDINLANKYVPL